MNRAIALGIVRGGIAGRRRDRSIGYIVLSLTPGARPEIQIDILAAVCHAFQDRIFLKAMDSAVTVDDVRDALALWTRDPPRKPRRST